MENLNKRMDVANSGGVIRKTKIEHPDCVRTSVSKKVVLSKKKEKMYKVTVTYVQVSDDEAKVKRSIIENIIKKGHMH
ncbi:hypothetical protein [Pedobacter xixiisoli]|uniref:Transposon-encoded protein TnpW n=1 Tax=Pedobacter xixiisoli TaxID=1476464 RepID=A0A286A6U9_9SPHI|nr:hypothetical protein [Pedobacter xixiisoli]SOD17653.1 hypothetical protein SAMN06297358_2620 [Pedobacter xixiisoli]